MTIYIDVDVTIKSVFVTMNIFSFVAYISNEDISLNLFYPAAPAYLVRISRKDSQNIISR